MSMQDKELDHLFSSSLNGFEAEPSPKVWNAINAELNRGRGNRKILSYLSIAASLLILLAAGVYFIPKIKDTAGNKPPKNGQLVKVDDEPKTINKDEMVAQTIDEPKRERISDSVRKIASQPVKVKSVISAKVEIEKPAAIVDEQPAEQEIAQVTEKPATILKPVVPDASIPLIVKQEVNEDIKFKTAPEVLVAQLSPKNNEIAAPQKRRGIHSLGDLINVVVSKVDKRKDKLIEFSDSDDDGSMVTGINLGIIKVKKED
ncbi:hypothetical protein [Mucilaginibacter segetis]|uniref:Uncharacterized protein n=1 Tax=Mucilaginibacter segetis TaxID=2793071 RepID=A0A934UKZ3_9SPHI|nr:hypothetical protein [Mucilaginibacter segetis]MBK0377814.1 hypothetical protein [Mucilaginibacter segetis]